MARTIEERPPRQRPAATPFSAGPAPSRAARPGRFRRWRTRGGLSTLLLALPVILIFFYFSWLPIVRGVVMSFQRNNYVAAPDWVGIDNFTYVLHDPLLGTAILNTLYFALLAILFGFPLPLLMAVIFSTVTMRRRWLYSLLAYLPVIVPPVVAILLWKVFYDPSSAGMFNSLLGMVGIPPQPWLNAVSSAMPSIVLEATWAGAGTSILIYLAAIASVRPELYEAAELDGAGIGSRIWHITIPSIRGIVMIMLLLQIIGAAQIFTEPFLFTGGGPQNATTTILLLLYKYAFLDGDYGAATALSVMLAVVLGLLSVGYFRLTRRWAD